MNHNTARTGKQESKMGKSVNYLGIKEAQSQILLPTVRTTSTLESGALSISYTRKSRAWLPKQTQNNYCVRPRPRLCHHPLSLPTLDTGAGWGLILVGELGLELAEEA